MKRSSLFITFEGGDGAGKSTLIEQVYAALVDRGHEVCKTFAPGGTKPGQVIRDLLLHSQQPLAKRTELLLFLADRAEQIEKVIKPALLAGKLVLCDRYNDSTFAYQGLARGFPLPKIEELCHFATEGVQPNLTLYLDIDPKVGLERGQKSKGSHDQIEAENIEFHQKIRKAFHQIREKDPSRFQIIDASQSKEAVFKEAFSLIQPLL